MTQNTSTARDTVTVYMLCVLFICYCHACHWHTSYLCDSVVWVWDAVWGTVWVVVRCGMQCEVW